MSSLRANLTLNLGVMGERNVQIKYDYAEAKKAMGGREVSLAKPYIYVHYALITVGGNTTDIIDFITDDDLNRLHNAILDENHL